MEAKKKTGPIFHPPWPREAAEVHCEAYGVRVIITRAKADDTVLVLIDTQGIGENRFGPAPLRVMLNDPPIYANPAFNDSPDDQVELTYVRPCEYEEPEPFNG